MLKKILIGSALVAGTGALIGGTSAYSYIKTGYHSVRDSIKEQIPIDLEIKRVRDMIQDLKPEIAENLRVIAREEVEVAKLQREVATKSVNLDKSKDAILKQLIADHEPPYAHQWRGLPETYTHAMLNGIVAFEMQVQNIQTKVKLNQHRPEAHAAMHAAYESGSESEKALALWMRRLGMTS